MKFSTQSSCYERAGLGLGGLAGCVPSGTSAPLECMSGSLFVRFALGVIIIYAAGSLARWSASNRPSGHFIST